MEVKIKTEQVTFGDWEMLPEPTLKCKKEPTTDLVATLPSYLVSDVKDISLHTQDVQTATPKQCRDTPSRAGTDSSEGEAPEHSPGAGDNSSLIDTEGSRDAFQNNSTNACPRKSVKTEEDVAPASVQNTEKELQCLGPFFIPTECPVCGDVIPDEYSAEGHKCFYSTLREAGYWNTCLRKPVETGECVMPAAVQNTEREPRCLGPFYIPTKCPVCTEEIPDGDAADGHKCLHLLLNEVRYNCIMSTPQIKLKCSMCDLPEFHTEQGFLKHVFRHFTKFYFSCSICDKKLRSKGTFTSHSYTHSGRWPFRCRVCGAGCASKTMLEAHEILHTDQKVAICETCGKSFRSTHSLYRHRELHAGKVHPCDVCNKVCPTSHALKRHLQWHKTVEEQKKYNCDLCEKIYSSPVSLKIHKDRNHGEMPKRYSCNICNKSVKSRAILKIHMKTHTGEKRYECDICKRKFSTKPAVARHIAEHSGEKNHSCDVCGMKFTQAGSVKRHKGTAHS